MYMTEAPEAITPDDATPGNETPIAVPPPVNGPAREAASRWLREHGDVLWRFVLARTGSPELTEDLVQDTLLAGMQSYSRFAGQSSERTWLLGIASHKVADHFRRQAHRSGPSAPGVDSPGRSDLPPDDFTRDGLWACEQSLLPDSTSTLERQANLDALRHCLDLLPPNMGEAVWLRDVLAMPASEVCQALGITTTNLWTRLHRARVALRKCLDSSMGLRSENAP